MCWVIIEDIPMDVGASAVEQCYTKCSFVTISNRQSVLTTEKKMVRCALVWFLNHETMVRQMNEKTTIFFENISHLKYFTMPKIPTKCSCELDVFQTRIQTELFGKSPVQPLQENASMFSSASRVNMNDVGGMPGHKHLGAGGLDGSVQEAIHGASNGLGLGPGEMQPGVGGKDASQLSETGGMPVPLQRSMNGMQALLQPNMNGMHVPLQSNGMRGMQCPLQPSMGGIPHSSQPRVGVVLNGPESGSSGMHFSSEPSTNGTHFPPLPSVTGMHFPPQPSMNGTRFQPQPNANGLQVPLQPNTNGIHVPLQSNGMHVPQQTPFDGTAIPLQSTIEDAIIPIQSNMSAVHIQRQSSMGHAPLHQNTCGTHIPLHQTMCAEHVPLHPGVFGTHGPMQPSASGTHLQMYPGVCGAYVQMQHAIARGHVPEHPRATEMHGLVPHPSIHGMHVAMQSAMSGVKHPQDQNLGQMAALLPPGMMSRLPIPHSHVLPAGPAAVSGHGYDPGMLARAQTGLHPAGFGQPGMTGVFPGSALDWYSCSSGHVHLNGSAGTAMSQVPGPNANQPGNPPVCKLCGFICYEPLSIDISDSDAKLPRSLQGLSFPGPGLLAIR